MQLNKVNIYSLYENSEVFSDNFDNYGNSYCSGKIKPKVKVALNFNITCEAADQNVNKWWDGHNRAET